MIALAFIMCLVAYLSFVWGKATRSAEARRFDTLYRALVESGHLDPNDVY